MASDRLGAAFYHSLTDAKYILNAYLANSITRTSTKFKTATNTAASSMSYKMHVKCNARATLKPAQ